MPQFILFPSILDILSFHAYDSDWGYRRVHFCTLFCDSSIMHNFRYFGKKLSIPNSARATRLNSKQPLSF